MAVKHRVKIGVHVDRTNSKSEYQVVKETETPWMAPHGIVILGTFTMKSVAEKARKALNEAYNAPSEIEYRKRRS